MERYYDERKEFVIKRRQILRIDAVFEVITGISRSVYCRIGKGQSRPALKTIVTFCISMMLGDYPKFCVKSIQDLQDDI